MAVRYIFLSLATLISSCQAKFQYTYNEITSEAVNACLADTSYSFDRQSITLPRNCRDAFDCVLSNVPDRMQMNLSSGSAILGFIPTVLLILGNSNEDIIRVNARFPLLGFLLSITNITKRHNSNDDFVEATSGSPDVSLGLYGSVTKPTTNRFASGPNRLGLVCVYLVAILGASGVLWQTIDLGMRSVVSWSCWMDFWLLVWLCMAVLHHTLAAGCLRLCFESQNKTGPFSMVQLLICDLTGGNVKLRHPRFARSAKTLTDVGIDMTYIFGTAVFSSLTLVAATDALSALAIYGSIAVVSRLSTIWILKEMRKP